MLWNATTSICRRHSTSTTCQPPHTIDEDLPHQTPRIQIPGSSFTIVCHQAVDPSVVTQPVVTLTSEMIDVYAPDALPPLDDVNRQLLNFIEVFELNESGGYSPTYKICIPLPRWIQAMRAVVNVTVTGDQSLSGSYL